MSTSAQFGGESGTHLASDPDPFPGTDVDPGRAPGLGEPAEDPDPVIEDADE